MARRMFVRVLLTVVISTAWLVPTVADASASVQSPVAPFGLEDVTSRELTPARFAAALPDSFDGTSLTYVGVVAEEVKLHQYSATSENYFHYVGPTEESRIWVSVNDLGDEPTVTSAISGVAYAITSTAGFTVETQDTTSAAAVPFLLAHRGNSSYAAIWGAHDGDWVFSVLTPTEATRENFLRALAINLESQSGSQSVSDTDPSAASLPTWTPGTQLISTSESVREPTAAAPGDAPSTEGVQFEPDQLTMRLGEKETVKVVLPQKLRLTSKPTCRSGCDSYDAQIIDRQNGETQIRVTGLYDGSREPATLVLRGHFKTRRTWHHPAHEARSPRS